jgi:hypothetical protein
VFTGTTNPVIVFGVPNVSLLVPNGPRTTWQRFAAYMFWRRGAEVLDTKGRVQAGVFFELVNLPDEAVDALVAAAQSLVGTRKASCAHSVALALHRAGFTAGGRPLRWIYRPSHLASVLWQNGLKYRGQTVEVRIVQTRMSVADHFKSVWMRERESFSRLMQHCFGSGTHGRAPVFDPTAESVEMSDGLWTDGSPLVRIGVGVPSHVGVNLSYVFGEQPVFVAALSPGLDRSRLGAPLKPFPGKLDRATRLKKYVLFSWPVIWFIRKNLVARVEWLPETTTHSVAAMLRRSSGPERQAAFVYNFVLTGTELWLKRLQNDNGQDQKIINWMLAKHVLLAGYGRDVLLAGELWVCDGDGGLPVVYFSGDSGTYKPDARRTAAAAAMLSQMFQVRVVVVSRQE